MNEPPADERSLVDERLLLGPDGLEADYRRISAEPAGEWLTPQERAWTLTLLALGAGLEEEARDHARALLAAIPAASVRPDAPFPLRRGPAFGEALRGLAFAALGRTAEARAALEGSRSLFGIHEDAPDASTLSLLRAYAWAVLDDADGFFDELEPWGRRPALLSPLHLTQSALLSRFADHPRAAPLIDALARPIEP